MTTATYFARYLQAPLPCNVDVYDVAEKVVKAGRTEADVARIEASPNGRASLRIFL